MSTPSGTVVQYGILGGQIQYTDTGTYGTVTSRVLTVYSYFGGGNTDVIQVFNMGTNRTQIFSFDADAWFNFTCVVTDNTGAWPNSAYIVSQGYYWDAYTEQFNLTACGCIGNNCNLEVSQLALQAALRFNLAGLAGAASANREILAANFFVNSSIQVQLG